MHKLRAPAALVFAWLCLLGSCGPDGTPLGAPPNEVRIAPQPAVLEMESTLQMEALPVDGSGRPLEGRSVFWSTEDGSVAQVSQTGEVTGLAAGTTRIAASAEGVSGLATVTVVPRAVVRVEVTPDRLELVEGEVEPLAALLYDRTDRPLEGRPVQWVSLAPEVATVDAAGRVTAVRSGSAVVRATVEGVSGEATLSVSPKPVASVEVSPASARLVIGESQRFSALARAADGSLLPDRVVTWSSSAPGVLEIESDGRATAVQAGEAVVTALVEGQSGAATVAVVVKPVAQVELSPPSAQLTVGRSQQFVATLKAADGSTLTGRSIAWSLPDGAVATVDGSGRLTGVAVGQTTLTATSEGIAATAAITVSPVPVETVEISPAAAQLLIGGSRQLVATARAADGSVLSGRAIVWSIDDSQVATVSTSGLVSALRAGRTTVTATVEGKSATAELHVVAPVAAVEVTPSTVALIVQGTAQLTATARAADGTVLTGRPVAWSSSAPGVASVGPSGLVTALAPGQATITAVSEGKSGSAAVTVNAAPAPVATIEVTPSVASVAVNGTVQLSATLRAADGTELTGRPIAWSSSAPGIASVGPSGLVTALAPGQATITAVSEGKSGSAAVTVNAAPAPVATIEVSPSVASVAVNATVQLSATLRAADGTVLTGRPVTWSSSAPGVVTVSASGLVQGVATGEATVTATSEGKSGGAPITVTAAPPPVATVQVSPGNANLKVGDTHQFSATLKAADGTTLTGRTVSWSSSNPLVASVSSTGLVTALLPGQATITATSEGKSGSGRANVTLTELALRTDEAAGPRARRANGGAADSVRTLQGPAPLKFALQ